jgi:syntaxin-binding protein 1
LPEPEFQKINGSATLTARVKTLKEFNLDFLPYESQVFHFDMNDAMVSFFSANGDAARAKEVVASKLVTLMATLNEYPIIRFAQGQRVAAALATTVQQRLDALVRSATGWSPNEERAILLILDRTMDPISPLLHEFTYQAMVYDLLNVENDKYMYNYTTNNGLAQKKEVILGETDVLWPVLRHMHIADTIEWVIDSFNEFLKNNKATKLAGGKQIDSLKDMSEAMRAMPQYTEMLNKYSLHINMANTAMEAFNQQGIERIAHIEQDMATGEDAEHKSVKNVISRLPPILSDANVSKEDKMRLLIIYIISQEGIKDQDRKRLMELAKISLQEQATIANISCLGVTLNKGAKGKSKKESKKKKNKRHGDDVPFELSRYVPTLASILEDLTQDNLSNTEFPFVRDDPGNPSSLS